MADVIGRSSSLGSGTDLDQISRYMDLLSQADRLMSRSTTDITRSLDSHTRAMTQSVSGFEKAGQSLGKTLQVVGERLIKTFTASYSRIQNSYLNSFSDITTKMQLSAAEYTKMYRDAAADFRAQGLATQFTSADYISQLSENLATGLRGQIAESKSMQDLIVKKLVPAISTNSRGYREMYKAFGDQFAKNTAAFAKYTERIVGMEAYEESGFNTTLDQLFPFIRYAAKSQGVDPNAVLNRVIRQSAAMNVAGMDTSALFSGIYDALTGGVTSNKTLMMSGLTTAEDFIRVFGSEQGATQFARQYGATLEGLGSQGLTAGALQAQALGSNVFDVTNSAVAAEYYKAFNDLSAGFNANIEYQKYYGDLQAGEMTNITEQAENWTDNQSIVVDSATFIAEKIPYTNELLGDLVGIASGIWATLAGGKILGGSGVSRPLTRGAQALAANVTGLGWLGGAAGAGIASLGIYDAVGNFKAGNVGSGIADIAGAGLGVAGGIAAIAGAATVAPWLLGFGALVVGSTRVYNDFIKKVDGVGNSLSSVNDELADSLHATNNSYLEQLGTIKTLTDDTEKYNSLLELGVSESVLKTTNNFDELATSIGNNISALDAQTEAMLEAQTGEAYAGVKAGMGESFWNQLASAGTSQFTGEDQFSKAFGFFTAVASTLSEEDQEDFNKKLQKFAKDQVFTEAEINKLFGAQGRGANKYKLSAQEFSGLEGLQKFGALTSGYLGVEVSGLAEAIAANEQAEADYKKARTRVLSGEGAYGHATGLYEVGYDNYPALLHQGEMVLTKSNANAVRSFMEGKTSFKDTINNIVATTAAQASNAGNSSLLSSNISSQLDGIGTLLSSILDQVIEIASGANKTPTRPAPSANQSLLNYKGGVSY